MTDRNNVTPELLHQLIRFEPESGKFFWRPRSADLFSSAGACASWNGRYADAETLNTINMYGYCQGSILKAKYTAHRVLWAMVHGQWPEGEIDHINGVRTDNRIENLRCVSKVENLKNKRRPSNNSSGYSGVAFHKLTQKWQATIGKNYKRIYLGTYDKIEDAVEARRKALVEYGFHPNHGRKEQGNAG